MPSEWLGVSMMTSWAPMPFMVSNIPTPWRFNSPSTCSTGNLLGTTRTDQPGPLAGMPWGRWARISGGVRSSCPSQKGQAVGLTSWARGRKSVGRLLRSVEMITQWPVTASLRRSGIDEPIADCGFRIAASPFGMSKSVDLKNLKIKSAIRNPKSEIEAYSILDKLLLPHRLDRSPCHFHVHAFGDLDLEGVVVVDLHDRAVHA